MKFLKAYWENILIVLLGLALILSLRTCSNKNDRISFLEYQADSTKFVIAEEVDKNGRLQSKILVQQVTLNQYKENWEAESKEFKRQIGNLKNMVGYWKGKITFSDTVEIVLRDTVYLDGSTTRLFDWNNGYLELTGEVFPSTVDLKYLYTVDFTLVPYYKGKDLLTDIHFTDPHLKVREFKGLYIAPKQPRLSLGIGAGYGVVISKGTAHAGLGGFVGAVWRPFNRK